MPDTSLVKSHTARRQAVIGQDTKPIVRGGPSLAVMRTGDAVSDWP